MTSEEAAITSLLDTDMYKLTMHAAVYVNFPDTEVVYKYTNRSAGFSFNKAAIVWLEDQVAKLAQLRFTEEEVAYLRETLPFLPAQYIEYISSPEFRLDPTNQVQFSYDQRDDDEQYDLNINVEGLWKDTILYEIHMLALISEAYFKFVDTDWVLDGQVEQAYRKTKLLLDNGLVFSEFGTRRRRSLHVQDLVLQGITQAVEESGTGNSLFIGTSNIYFAKKYGVKPVGTVAHEWYMGIAALTDDYRNANKNAMDFWLNTFGSEHAGLVLTDTFGTDNFLTVFRPPYSDVYDGVRQDSGDPAVFTDKVANHYLNVLKYPRFSKVICYSDSLNPEKALQYAEVARSRGMKSSFGIGTNFTNDFRRHSDPSAKSEPLNIVFKLITVNGRPAIKISDDLGKNMGDPNKVEEVKRELGYIERTWEGNDEAHRWKD
ncbi:AaceriACR160Cp [[Ashbya] aceris (nom. inval.)]|nr:AaceriACR160Cp [[Ashbya] aceris (nom. inval.)]